MFRKHNILYLALVSLVPFPASAQMLEEVIVTARKRDESMQEVPVAVTAISAADLANASIRNLRDLEGFSPNLTIDDSAAGPGAAAISIRGVSYQEVDKSLDPSIGVIIDGIYLGTNVGQVLQNFDIARVEVLRGPQGTLFGKNTIGGVINVMRNKPRYELSGELRAGTGSENLRDFKGVLHFPILENKLAGKVYGISTKDDGWLKNTTINDDTRRKDYKTYGFSLMANPTEKIEAQFTYDRIEDSSDIPGGANRNQPANAVCTFGILADQGIPIPGVDWSASQACEALDTGSDEDHVSLNDHQTADLTTDAYTLRTEWELGPGIITMINGYRDNDESRRAEFDASSAEFLYITFDQDYEQTSHELQFTSTFSDTVEFVAGLYYWNAKYSQFSETFELWPILGPQVGFPPGLLQPGDTGHLNQKQETDSIAGYFQGDWHFSENLTATVGVRYTEEQKDFKAESASYWRGDINLLPAAESSTKEDWDEVTPKFGLRYQYSDDVMLFASYARGFKSGGFFGRNTTVDSLNQSYDPETVDTYELGAKTDWLDGRVRVNATAFYSKYDDKQEENFVALPGGTVETLVTNAGTVDMPGFELEVLAAVTDNLRMRASWGYLDAEFDEFDGDLNGDGTVTDNSDLKLRRAPKNTFGAGASYNRNIGPGEFVGDVSYRWRDDFETIADNNPLGHVDAFGIWNASVDYIYENWQLSVYGRNLDDERYLSSTVDIGLSAFGTWNQGRNWGAELRYTF
jgi:iron complex outermembrane receptor protein